MSDIEPVKDPNDDVDPAAMAKLMDKIRDEADTEPEVEPEIPKVPDPADVVRVAAPADDLGKEIFKAQALQARQKVAEADVEVVKSQRMVDNPDITYNADDHAKVVEAKAEAQKVLDVIVAATGVDPHDVERDTISGVASLIAEHQGFVSQWTTTRRQHQLMADSPEAFGHNRLDVAWVEENRKNAAILDDAIATREAMIVQLQAQAEQLKADEKAKQKAGQRK